MMRRNPTLIKWLRARRDSRTISSRRRHIRRFHTLTSASSGLGLRRGEELADPGAVDEVACAAEESTEEEVEEYTTESISNSNRVGTGEHTSADRRSRSEPRQ